MYCLAVVTMLAGLTMLFISLFIAPKGEIHHSVLTAFGTICIFVASLLGISIHYANELSKFKSQALSIVQDMKENSTDQQILKETDL